MTSMDETRPTHLLLLPPPPRPVTQDSIKAAYEAPISTLLKRLEVERRREPEGAIIEIAVPISTLASSGNRSRSELFHLTQDIVASVYKLVCVIAAVEDINIEDRKGIDVRVILLAHASRKVDERGEENGVESKEEEGEEKGEEKDNETTDPEPTLTSIGTRPGNLIDPVVSLESLARCQRAWNSIVGVESEEGEAMLREFLTSQDDRMTFQKVPGGIVHVELNAADALALDEAALEHEVKSHHSVAVGGTFDHIHVGHKLLLTMFAFMMIGTGTEQASEQRRLTVGITGDELLRNKKYAELLESWDDRQRTVLDFLRAILDFRPTKDAHVESERRKGPEPNENAVITVLGDLSIDCVELSDPFGPTITDEAISALVISAETRSGGEAINKKRKEKGWAPLDVFEVSVLDANDFGSKQETKDSFEGKLSSTTIRKQLSERTKAEA